MPKTITVSEVRNAIYYGRDSRNEGEGDQSTAILGQWFHEVFASLLSGIADPDRVPSVDDPESLQQVVDVLKQHVYRVCIGPRLPRYQGLLVEQTTQLLSFWKAVDDMTRWLVDLKKRATLEKRVLRICSEEGLSCELHEREWTDSVRLVGQADAIIYDDKQQLWCGVELKLGRGHPEADLAQSCLYHAMLPSRHAGGRADGSLALVGFKPERQCKAFSPVELERALPALKALIGRLAGVLPPDGAPTVPAPPRGSELAERLLRVLEEFGAPAKLCGEIITGPTFIRFPLETERGISVAKVKKLPDELQHRLRLDAPPLVFLERGQLVADIQRPDRQIVSLSDYLNKLPVPNPMIGSAFVPIGVNLQGELQFANLAEPQNAHVLVAGTTGSGKSEWLRVALAVLLLTNNPASLRLVLIDPKRQAFSELADSAFLRDKNSLVFPDEQKVTGVLDSLIDEMESRYASMHLVQADNLVAFINKTGRTLPRIVCVCDEYADLISRGPKERRAIEDRVVRLGQKARACGIHLILATQQPSRQIIKGALDSNMPCRVGLQMAKAIESRMLLETEGAEKLLGNGDLLFKDIGPTRRLQGLWIAPDLRMKIFAQGNKYTKPQYVFQ